MVGRKWIRVTPSRTYDLSDAFDFSSHLLLWEWFVPVSCSACPTRSQGVQALHPWLTAGDHGSGESSAQTNQVLCWACSQVTRNPCTMMSNAPCGSWDCLICWLSVGTTSPWCPWRFLFIARTTSLDAHGECAWRGGSLGLVAATGWSLSAIRAAVMASLGWWFLVRGRSLNTWGLLAAAGCVVAVVEPMSPLQLGAQLSFAATAAASREEGTGFRVPSRSMGHLALEHPRFPNFSSLIRPTSLRRWRFGSWHVVWQVPDWVSSGSCVCSIRWVSSPCRWPRGSTIGRADLECGVDRPCGARSGCLGTGFVVGVSAASRTSPSDLG